MKIITNNIRGVPPSEDLHYIFTLFKWGFFESIRFTPELNYKTLKTETTILIIPPDESLIYFKHKGKIEGYILYFPDTDSIYISGDYRKMMEWIHENREEISRELAELDKDEPINEDDENEDEDEDEEEDIEDDDE